MRKFADVLRSIVALLAIARRIQPDEHRLTEFLDNVYQELEIADGAISRLFDQSLKNYHITSGGYASLLNAVFGEKFPELATLVKHEIILVLSTEGYPIEKSKFHSLIWTNLFHKLVDGDWSSQLNVLDKLKIDAEISTLTEREQKVIRLRFGLEPDEKQYTLREVGEIFHLTHQRIRDIEMKALRKLRHPSRSRNLQHLRRPMHERYSEVGLLAANNEGVEPDRYLGDLIQIPAVKTLKEELHTAQTERASLYDENRSLKELLPKTMEQVWERQRQFLSLPIYDLELSVRAYTCLRNADIRSVRELCVYTEQDLYAIRSFGKKSMAEIKDILGGMSLKLGMDASEISIILGEKTL